MKFILICLAVFGVASAAVAPRDVNSAMDQIKAMIPTEDIMKIYIKCQNDPEVEQIRILLGSDLVKSAVNVIREDKDVLEFFAELEKQGVEFTVLNWLLSMWGFPPIGSQRTPNAVAVDCGGWRGMYNEIQEKITFGEIYKKIEELHESDKEFREMWDTIGEAEATFVRIFESKEWVQLIAVLEQFGVDIGLIRDVLNGLFGWNLE